MENCLVTTLKAEVNNDNLERFGTLSFSLTPYADPSVAYKFTGLAEAYVEGNAYFTDSAGATNKGKTTTDATFYLTNVSDGDVLYVKYKHNISYIQFYEKASVTVLKANSEMKLNGCISLGTFIASKYDPNVHLNFNEFAKNCVALTYFRYHNNAYLTGDIEAIVENLVSAGRVSGTLVIGAARSSIKLNGSTFMTGSNEYVKITFNSATNVTVHAGEQGAGALLASWDGSTWTYGS